MNANASTSSTSCGSSDRSNSERTSIVGIPMPMAGEAAKPVDNVVSAQNAAWQKAQAALKKVNPGAACAQVSPSVPPRSPMDIQAAMRQMYPWMAHYNMGFSFAAGQGNNMFSTPPPPPPPGFPPTPPGGPFYPLPRMPPPSAHNFGMFRPRTLQFSPRSSAQSANSANERVNFFSSAPRGGNRGFQNLSNGGPSLTPPVRFFIRSGQPGARPNVPPQHQSPDTNALVPGNIPDNVRKYVERAYLAVEKSDRGRVEEYLKKKLHPLLESGAWRAVKWDKEPLPSEVNFEVKTDWTPASELRKSQGQSAPLVNVKSNGSWQHNQKERRVSLKRSKSPRSPSRKRERKQRKCSPSIRFDSSGRSSSDSDIRIVTPRRESNSVKKKNKKKKKETSKTRWVADDRSNARREERARRFARDSDNSMRKIRQTEMRKRLLLEDDGAHDSSQVIVGTSSEIEKQFFRLTAAPDPSTVRPLRILERALKLVQRKYTANGDYRYANDQLRSIRQDLMVQCIRTDFTVNVYETNARVAIENADREEYNKCQSQLKLLYNEVPNSPNEYEFTSYRLLYYIAIANTIDQTTMLRELNRKAREDPCVSFALNVREAWALSNYARLFKLYSNAPRMASYVMDLFMERERTAALNACLKSYRPSISVSALANIVCLEEAKAVEWLAKLEIRLEPGRVIDCRQHGNAIS